MNTKLLFGLAALATSSAFALQMWNASSYRVDTGMDDGSDESGYWFTYDDANNQGNSTITFNTAKGNEYDDNALDPIIDACGGLCGDFSLGNGYKYPFVGLGFNLMGPDQTGGDVTAWGGLCLIYSTTGTAPTLEVSPEDEKNYTEYNNYASKLAVSPTATTVTLDWTKFKQETGWGKTIPQETYLTKVAQVKFKISGTAGKSGSFNIISIGTAAAADCAPYGTQAIGSTKAASSVKAQLSGRTLSFAGFTSAATAEIINLQGEVVMSSAVNAGASMNLASLEAGVYMVRVAGKSVNFTNKVVLK